MELLAVLFAALSGLSVSLSSATCIFFEGGKENLELTDLEGNITYAGTYRNEDCSWILPAVNNSQHVLFIYLEYIYMQYRDQANELGCSGHINLPEVDPLCTLPSKRCYLYTTSDSECNLNDIGKIMKNESADCSSVDWHQVGALPQNIKIMSDQVDPKNFSISYDIINCQPKEQEKKEALTGTSNKNGTNENSAGRKTDPNFTSPSVTGSPQEAGSYTAFIVIVSVLCVALVLMVGYLGFQWWKRRRLSDKATNPSYNAASTEESAPEMRRSPIRAIPTNDYEEIPMNRAPPNSREVVTNSIYQR